jgi:hypothetical protein
MSAYTPTNQGHQLDFGVNQDAHDVMGEHLAPGVRRLSTADEVVPAATLSARQPAPSVLAADIVAALTAGQFGGLSLPSNPVPAGPKSDANLRSSQPPLLLSSAGEEVGKNLPPFRAGRAVCWGGAVCAARRVVPRMPADRTNPRSRDLRS